jgi:hypothetical protein
VSSKIRKRFWNDGLLIAGTAFIFVSLACFSRQLTQQKITRPSDLETVQDKISHYSFVNGYRGTRYYDIFLAGGTTPYKIPAEFLRCFDKSSFESKVHSGDVLKLSFNKRLWVFSIADTNRSYLPTDSTIEIYNKSAIQVGLWLFSLGIVSLIGRYLRDRNKLSLSWPIRIKVK